MKTFLISPPFSRWYRPSWATPVLGTFTVEPRPGFWLQMAKTFRPVPGGWRNQIGLRNSGLPEVYHPDIMYSVSANTYEDWRTIDYSTWHGCWLELNVSCPSRANIYPETATIRQLTERCVISIKHSPYKFADSHIKWLLDLGVQYFHFSNTLPSHRGGISGDQLREINLPLVEAAAKIAPGRIIAGGGIYTPEHVRQYCDAGATHFSITTVCMTPWRLPALKTLALEANGAN